MLAIASLQLIDTTMREIQVPDLVLHLCRALATMFRTQKTEKVPLSYLTRNLIAVCQVLIMNPTRELAVQTQKVIMAIGDFMQVCFSRLAPS